MAKRVIKCNRCQRNHQANCVNSRETIVSALNSKQWLCKRCKYIVKCQEQNNTEPELANPEEIDLREEEDIDLDFWKEVLEDLAKEDKTKSKEQDIPKLKIKRTKKRREIAENNEKQYIKKHKFEQKEEAKQSEAEQSKIESESEAEVEWLVEDIIDYHWQDDTFLIKWAGFSKKHNSWEPRDNLSKCEQLLNKFRRTRKFRKSLLRAEIK